MLKFDFFYEFNALFGLVVKALRDLQNKKDKEKEHENENQGSSGVIDEQFFFRTFLPNIWNILICSVPY